MLDAVPAGVVKYFNVAAQEILKEKTPEEALAAALAHISGATLLKTRSLINSQQVGVVIILLNISSAPCLSMCAFD